MRIALQLDSATAQAVRGRLTPEARPPGGDGALPLEQVVERAGAVVHPVHPDAVAGPLSPYFFIDVPDDAETADVLAALQRTPGVEAAYIEPSAEPPKP